MASSRKRWMLTEDNLRRFQPSLIQPMEPVSISSRDDGDNDAVANEDPAVDAVIAREAPAARVARLRSWVYNAMLTLVGLGDEGVAVLADEELYIAGPGDVRLAPRYRKRTTARLKTGAERIEGAEGAEVEADQRHYYRNSDDNDDDNDETEEQEQEGPDLSDPAYWQAKLRYLEAKCRPLSQAHRKRRRLAPASQIAAEDAARAEAEASAAEGRGYGCGYDFPSGRKQQQEQADPQILSDEQRQAREEARAEARAEQARIEQSKLLWRDKRGNIERWVQTIPPPPALPKSSPRGQAYWSTTGGVPHLPYGGLGGPAFDSQHDLPVPYYQQPAAVLSDSSIVEITPAQFSNVQPDPPHETQQQEQLQQQQQQHQQQEARQQSQATTAMRAPYDAVLDAERSAVTAQPVPQHTTPHDVADASLDLSAVTAATAPPTAATPATQPIETPNTSASPGEVPNGDDASGPTGAASHKRGSHGQQGTPAARSKRRRVGTDTDNDCGKV
ncbi:hypothetical protein SPBR_02751 [Sporothrix brasiliensis 5110]|uniref:Uncharacterized protein n=1 Tax=Sporothrix brasiliensis 5110 TaxID=1398154 RepID=A0A0C2J4Q4_9PEZI|nr:uncharacterized protein SPBR_02751 [Sporothrix brasiliensis 5110]KIH92047.1 hypothetical protein SPBR_02751 [Sporothrix brasiliensis 5110]